MTELISLFDYLRYPAGSELGAEVARYAKKLGAEIGIRQVTNRKYSGPVNLYTKDLLESFFTREEHQSLIIEDKQRYTKKLLKKHESSLPKIQQQDDYIF